MRRSVLATSLAVSLLTLGATTAQAGGEGWITDMQEAMKVAKAEDKLILMDFTGSDWCGWCIKLKDEVFTQSEFKQAAPEDFVLVELDFPRNKELSEEQVAHNDKWRDKFEISGYPTIILADADGNAFARTGYRAGGAGPYMEHLDNLRSQKAVRDTALDAAKKVDGLARAKMLDWALSVDDIIIPDPTPMMEEIIALDSENMLGLRDKYEQRLQDMLVDEELATLQQNLHQGDPASVLESLRALKSEYNISPTKQAEVTQYEITTLLQLDRTDEALELIEKTVAMDDADATIRQQIAAQRVDIFARQGNVDRALEALDAMIEIDPDTDFASMIRQRRDAIEQQLRQQAQAAGGGG